MNSQTENKSVPAERHAGETRICILVTGMHRSGTSALTKVLGLMGADLPRHPFEPNEHNEKGYWESEPIVLMHEKLLRELGRRWDDLGTVDLSGLPPPRRQHYRAEIIRLLDEEYADSWLFVVKDPRLCLLAPLWLETLATAGIDVRFVLPIRDAVEVARSLETRDGKPASYGCLLWLRHVLDAEHATRGHRRAFVTYEDLLDDPAKVAAGLASRLLDGALTSTAQTSREIGSFVDRGLRHHVTAAAPEQTGPLATWLATADEAHRRLLVRPDDNEAQQRLDALRGEFDRACGAFLPLLLGSEPPISDGQPAKLEAALQEAMTAEAALRRRLAESETLQEAQLLDMKAGRAELMAVHRSLSWRLTSPLRMVSRLFGRQRST